MAINLNSSAAQAAVNSVQNAEQNKNKPADGFEDGLELGFDDLMSAYNEENFGGTTESGDAAALGTGLGTGQNMMGPVAFGGAPAAGTNPVLGQGMNGLGINGQLGQLGVPQQPTPRKITTSDIISDGCTEAVKATGTVLKNFVSSLGGVSCDDLASLSMDTMTCGAVMTVIGVILLIASASGNPITKAFSRVLMPAGLYQVAYR